MELILLSLPFNTIHTEIASMRTIHTSQTTSRTWHLLIQESTPLRQKLYLPTGLDRSESQTWLQRTAFSPAEPTPWIPHLILNQRSWSSAWPFETNYTASLQEGLGPSRPKFWTFALELSRAQYARLPAPGAWRGLLATSPPFTDFWYTRAFYELGSGRAPFVTHIDYNAKRSKSEQKYSVHCPDGVTLGDLVDAYSHLFEKHPAAKFVMVESVRATAGSSIEPPTTKPRPLGSNAGLVMDERLLWTDPKMYGVEEAEDRPTTKTYLPGSSAERAHGWQRASIDMPVK